MKPKSPRACLLTMLLLAGAVGVRGQTLDVDRELEEAKALYREAKFAQAIAKLDRVIGRLEQLRDLRARKDALADALLHLALSYVALNDPVAARESLKAMLRVDRERRLDPQVYAPKVIALLEEARAEVAGEPARTATETLQPPAPPASPAATAPKKGRSKTVLILLGAAGAAAAGIAVAVGGGGGPPSGGTPTAAPTSTPTPSPTRGQGDIVFLGASPPPGSTVSLGVQTVINLTFSVVYSADVRDHEFHIDFGALGHPVFTLMSCVTWSGSRISLSAGQAVTVTVPVVASARTFQDRNCPLPLTTDRIGVSIEPPGRFDLQVLRRDFDARYTFVP